MLNLDTQFTRILSGLDKFTHNQHSFYVAIIVLLNRLPSELVLRADLDPFKDFHRRNLFERVCQIKNWSP